MILRKLNRIINIVFPLRNAREKLGVCKKVNFTGRRVVVKNTRFAGYNSLSDDVTLVNCSVGTGTYINQKSRLIGSKIGNYCSIADNVYSGFGHHPLDNISTHPAFFYDTGYQLGWGLFDKGEAPVYDPFRHPERSRYVTEIGNDVWIGSHVMIMDGVTIGDGAVIGTGSVVTHDIPPYAIAVGVPAKVIRYRHSEEDIKSLLESQWWNKSPEWLKENIDSFKINSIGFLLKKTYPKSMFIEEKSSNQR